MTEEETITPFPEYWTHGHSISFIYFTFAEVTDGEFSEDEASVIKAKLNQLGVPEESQQEAWKFYGGRSHNAVNTMATRCWHMYYNSDFGTLKNLQGVVNDLKSIANADGKVTDSEKETIAWFESTFEWMKE